MITFDELSEVIQPHQIFFLRVVNVCSIIIVPNFFRPGFFRSWFCIKKYHVCLYAVRIKDARWQAQDGMKVGGFEHFLPDGFACASFEQYVVRNNNSRLTGCFEHCTDVLNKIELFVAGCRPEILTIVCEIFFFLFPFLVGEGHTALLAKRRICEYIIYAHTGICYKRIGW